MAYCPKCNRPLKKGEKKSDHICDTVRLEDGKIVQRHRIRPGGDLYGQKVVEEAITKPVESIGEKFKRGGGGAVLLGDKE